MIRIVKLTFKEEHTEQFLHFIQGYKSQIRSFPGCLSVDFLRDLQDPNIFFTYSHWEAENALEQYRKSELFQYVWSTVKIWFAAKAEAWSVDPLP